MLLYSIHLYIQTCSVFLLLLMLLLLKRTKNVIMLMTTKYFCLQCFIYSRNFDVCTCVYICRQQDINLVIISCSTCCLVGPVKATWVCASFDSNLVIISCSTCCLVGPVKATWVCASFDRIFLCVFTSFRRKVSFSLLLKQVVRETRSLMLYCESYTLSKILRL